MGISLKTTRKDGIVSVNKPTKNSLNVLRLVAEGKDGRDYTFVELSTELDMRKTHGILTALQTIIRKLYIKGYLERIYLSRKGTGMKGRGEVTYRITDEGLKYYKLFTGIELKGYERISAPKEEDREYSLDIEGMENLSIPEITFGNVFRNFP